MTEKDGLGKMLFALDVGNTNINMALLDDDKVLKKAKVTSTGIPADALKNSLLQFVENYKIDGIVCANVVKELESLLQTTLKDFAENPLFINAYLDLGYKIQDDRKASVGADIIATNAGAYALYGDCLVVDTGTATTFQVIKDGEFKGCVIASGLYMGVQALYDFTSLLPKITVEKPQSVLGTDTIGCMQSGAFYGHAGMIEGIIRRIKEEVAAPLTVVATGGAAKMINEALYEPFDIIDNDLIFKGLKIIYDKNGLRVTG